MKTAEEWYCTLPRTWVHGDDCISDTEMTGYIRKIQIDALQEAAAIADSFADYDETRDGRKIGRNIRSKIPI